MKIIANRPVAEQPKDYADKRYLRPSSMWNEIGLWLALLMVLGGFLLAIYLTVPK